MIDFYLCSVFLFDDAAPPGICSLSLHDALPIWVRGAPGAPASSRPRALLRAGRVDDRDRARCPGGADPGAVQLAAADRKSTRLNSSHVAISYAVFCLKKKTTKTRNQIMVK